MATGIAFTKVREIVVAGFAAEADPNVSAPASASLYDVPDRVTGEGSDNLVRGHTVKFTYVDGAGAYVAGGALDFKAWYQDASNPTRFVSLSSETGAAANGAFSAALVGNLFHQVTAMVAPGGATKLQVWAAPRVEV